MPFKFIVTGQNPQEYAISRHQIPTSLGTYGTSILVPRHLARRWKILDPPVCCQVASLIGSSPFLAVCYLCLGLFYGHTGHVRFLTSVELGRSVTQPPTTGGLDVAAGSTAPRRHATFSGRVASSTPSSGGGGGGQRYRPTTPPLPSVSATAPSAVGGSSLVISGGDGFEDFRASSTDNESAGRDDSTNHLLLWRI